MFKNGNQYRNEAFYYKYRTNHFMIKIINVNFNVFLYNY